MQNVCVCVCIYIYSNKRVLDHEILVICLTLTSQQISSIWRKQVMESISGSLQFYMIRLLLVASLLLVAMHLVTSFLLLIVNKHPWPTQAAKTKQLWPQGRRRKTASRSKSLRQTAQLVSWGYPSCSAKAKKHFGPSGEGRLACSMCMVSHTGSH